MRPLLPILICLLTTSTFAQNRSKVTAQPFIPGSVVPDTGVLAGLQYRPVGPFRGGRSAAVCGDLHDKNTFYFGATGGGVWKTTDGGSNWRNITDGYFGGSIGAVSVAPSDPTILYVGTGENSIRGNVSEGFGLWRSDDGGRSWRHLGLTDTRHIVRVIIHPKNPDIVWVAALGHLFGPNEERGVFKTTDGGKTWKRTLFADTQSGAADLIMEPGNPQVFYASTWSVIRTPYSLESGGAGSALWKSVDGGETWTKLNGRRGLPQGGIWGISGVAVSPINPDRVWAIIEHEKGGLFRSDDGGQSWQLTSSDANIRQRAWYFSKLAADPKQEDVVWALNVQLWRSKDGGKTFQSVRTQHADHHDMWIDPQNSSRMIVANDGGGQISFDAGIQWSSVTNQPTGQFYRVSTDNHHPFRILGAQQDNSTVRMLSRTPDGEINTSHWTSTAGFESGYVIADPSNPDIVYGGNYGGYLSRLDHRTGENRPISVWPENPIGSAAADLKIRFQWNFPIFFSPHNPKKLYAAANQLFVTENEGASWKAISGDLTTDDKSKQISSGGPITKDNTSVEYYCTIFTATESALEKDLLWTGSDDGLIHVSRDGGKSWTNVTPPAAGKWMMWNAVEADPFQPGTAYFAGTKYKLDDYRPYLFKTTDYGKTWTLITAGIPATHFTRVIRADLNVAGLLYAGTEFGMYVSMNGGQLWQPMQLNLPMVSITDLTLKENSLVVATQGRGFWVLDDLTVVQDVARKRRQGSNVMHTYPVTSVYRYEGRRTEKPRNAGMNPPVGVVAYYRLQRAADSDTITALIRNQAGDVVREFSTHPSMKSGKTAPLKIQTKEGLNMLVWDMYHAPAENVEGLVLWNGEVPGPLAAPGNYTISWKHSAGDSSTFPFQILHNPAYRTTAADAVAQEKFMLAIRDTFSRISKTIKEVRELRKQLNEFSGRVGKAMPDDVKKMTDSIQRKLTVIEEAFYQTKLKSIQDPLNYGIRLNDKISGLYDYAGRGQNAPTQQGLETFADLSAQAHVHLQAFRKLQVEEIPALNKLVLEKGLPLFGLKLD